MCVCVCVCVCVYVGGGRGVNDPRELRKNMTVLLSNGIFIMKLGDIEKDTERPV